MAYDGLRDFVATLEREGELVRITQEIDPEPLKLVGFSVGKKGASSRSLSYEFAAGDMKMSSQELQELQARGHLSNGRLADVAPTLLDLMGIPAPAAMTGHSLFTRDLN